MSFWESDNLIWMQNIKHLIQINRWDTFATDVSVCDALGLNYFFFLRPTLKFAVKEWCCITQIYYLLYMFALSNATSHSYRWKITFTLCEHACVWYSDLTSLSSRSNKKHFEKAVELLVEKLHPYISEELVLHVCCPGGMGKRFR